MKLLKLATPYYFFAFEATQKTVTKQIKHKPKPFSQNKAFKWEKNENQHKKFPRWVN